MLLERVVKENLTTRDVEDVLLDLGHPQELANNYHEGAK